MKRSPPWIACALAALLFCTAPTGAATAPDFNLWDTEGKRANLKALLDKGPVLLDFWATYCKPCLKAMPKLEEIHNRYKDRGLTVLGVNEDGPRNQTKVKPFLRARKITFRSVFDADGGLMRRMQVGALPVTFLIAQDGEIVLRQTGYHPDVRPLAEAIEALLPTAEVDKEATGDAPSEN